MLRKINDSTLDTENSNILGMQENVYKQKKKDYLDKTFFQDYRHKDMTFHQLRGFDHMTRRELKLVREGMLNPTKAKQLLDESPVQKLHEERLKNDAPKDVDFMKDFYKEMLKVRDREYQRNFFMAWNQSLRDSRLIPQKPTNRVANSEDEEE